jgi:hypothetical protein
MIGDMEKILSKGDRFDVSIEGKTTSVQVKATDITGYERRYLVKPDSGDPFWLTNNHIRIFKYPN